MPIIKTQLMVWNQETFHEKVVYARPGVESQWLLDHTLTTRQRRLCVIKAVQVPDDYKLGFFDVKSLFTSIPPQLALVYPKVAVMISTVKLPLPSRRHYGPTYPLPPYPNLLSVQGQTLQTVTWNSYGFTRFRCRWQKLLWKTPRYKLLQHTNKQYRSLWLRNVDDIVIHVTVHKDHIDILTNT